MKYLTDLRIFWGSLQALLKIELWQFLTELAPYCTAKCTAFLNSNTKRLISLLSLFVDSSQKLKHVFFDSLGFLNISLKTPFPQYCCLLN